MEFFLERAETTLKYLNQDLAFACESAEIQVIQESGTTDDLCLLYEEAISDNTEKKKNIFMKIFDRIKEVISKIIEKIINLFKKKDDLKNNKEQIQVDHDLDSANSNMKAYIDKQSMLLNKALHGGKVSDDIEKNKNIIDKLKAPVKITLAIGATVSLIFKGKDILKYVQSKLDSMKKQVENQNIDTSQHSKQQTENNSSIPSTFGTNRDIQTIIMDTSKTVMEFTNILNHQYSVIENKKNIINKTKEDDMNNGNNQENKLDGIKKSRRKLVNILRDSDLPDEGVKQIIKEAEKIYGQKIYEPVNDEYIKRFNTLYNDHDIPEDERIHAVGNFLFRKIYGNFSKEMVELILKNRKRYLHEWLS